MLNASFHVYVELAGVGGGWTLLDEDLLAVIPIHIAYGIDGTSPKDMVASTGTLTFGLDNSESNSAGLLGLYSPGHVNCLAGFAMGIGVRVVIEYQDLLYEKWRGIIDEIHPTAGLYQERQSIITCVDWMDEAARTKLNMIPVQLNQRSDQVFNTILANIPKQPAASQVGYGMEAYAYALDNVEDEGFAVLTEFQKLAASELGKVYMKGGVAGVYGLVFEDRRRRGTVVESVASFNGVNAIVAGRSRNAVINRVQVLVHPRVVDVSSGTAFVPTDLASLKLWLKADAITGLVDGDAVASWLDSGPNGYNFVQATATNKPKYKTGMVNGKPTVLFDGSNDFMTTTAVLSDLIANNAGTIFVVARWASGNGVMFIDSGSKVRIDFSASGATLNCRNDDGGGLDNAQKTGLTPSDWILVTWLHTGGNIEAGNLDTRDASLTSTPSGNTSALTGTGRLGSTATPGNFLGGDIAEIIIFNTALSESDRQKVESYLSLKYALTIPYDPTGVTTAGEVIIFKLEEVQYIPRKTSITLKCPYKDPSQNAQRIGAYGQLNPVAATDYHFDSNGAGTGTDQNSQLSFVTIFGGNTAEIIITNNGPDDGYLTFFQLRGFGVYDEDEVVLEAKDDALITQFGENLFSLDMPYQSDPSVARDAANYMLSQNKSGVTVLEGAGFIANQTDFFMRQAILREISDRIDVSEEMTAVGGAFFINSVDLELTLEGTIICSWGLVPAITEVYYILDKVGQDEIDDLNIKLAYGLWNRYWILGVATLGADTRVNP